MARNKFYFSVLKIQAIQPAPTFEPKSATKMTKHIEEGFRYTFCSYVYT